eukprot:3783338-Prymnesium_polylepis.1
MDGFRRPAPSRCEFTPAATPREVFTADRAAGGRADARARWPSPPGCARSSGQVLARSRHGLEKEWFGSIYCAHGFNSFCPRRRVVRHRRFFLSKRCRGGTLDDPLRLRPR